MSTPNGAGPNHRSREEAYAKPAEPFCGFVSIERARDDLAKLKGALAGDLNVAYSDDFLKAAAATDHFSPGEFERLADLLKGKGVTIGRWREAVHRIARIERERISGLEKAAKARGGAKQPDKPSIELKAFTPWHEPVDTATLLDAIKIFVKRFVSLDEHKLTAVVLWIAFANCFEVADVAPRLALLSPMKRCGKTTLERLLALLCPRALMAANISPSAIFRAIDAVHPTLLLDEVDSFAGRRTKQSEKAEELRGILNSGHTPDSAYVIRSDKVGDRWEARRFSTWAPIAYAAIGGLPDTWEDRSIIVRMKRRLKSETVEKMTRRNLKTVQVQADELASKLTRWAADNSNALRNAPAPMIPKSLNDRSEDNWDLLLSIAELAGPEWTNRARLAADRISGDRMDGSTNLDFDQLLLSDIKAVLETHPDPDLKAIGSSELCQCLAAIKDSPWSAMKPNDRPITTTRLARMLRPFECYPKKTADQNEYTLSDLQEALDRYLPSATLSESAHQPSNSPQTVGGVGENGNLHPPFDFPNGGLKNDFSATESKRSGGLEGSNTENGKGAGKGVSEEDEITRLAEADAAESVPESEDEDQGDLFE